MSSAAAKPAVLSSSLLVRRGAQPAALSGRAAPSRPVAASLPNDERVGPNSTSPATPLFYIKGAASAEQFRSNIRRAAQSGIAVPAPAPQLPPLSRPRPRLWMRVDAEYRARMKRAASARGQTCQAFLADAASLWLAGLATPLAPAAQAEPAIAPMLSPERPVAPRVKLSVAVTVETHGQMHRAAARLGRTVQSCLCDAIESHAGRATMPHVAMN